MSEQKDTNNKENTNNKNPFKDRLSSGWQRVFIIICASIIEIFFGCFAYKLTVSGTKGDWKIVSDFRGWELYISSISPGLFFILAGTIIFVYTAKILKNLK
ncbi:MAG: hypothetical protein ABH881_02525 [bacterium]